MVKEAARIYAYFLVLVVVRTETNILGLYFYTFSKFPLDFIEHNLLEKGQSHMEVDSMHNGTETTKKRVHLYNDKSVEASAAS